MEEVLKFYEYTIAALIFLACFSIYLSYLKRKKPKAMSLFFKLAMAIFTVALFTCALAFLYIIVNKNVL